MLNNFIKSIFFVLILGFILHVSSNKVKYDSECLVNNELYVSENDKIDISFTIEQASSSLNITLISNNTECFSIEPQYIFVDYNETLQNENRKEYENMTLYGYNYGSSTLQLNIVPLDNKQDEVNKIIKINVVRSEKKLFDGLQIAFTVLFLFTVGLGMPLSTVIKTIKVDKAKPVIAGLLAQVVIIPLIALGLTKIFQLSDISSYSVMMIASSPGSLFATIFIYYIGGDKPLSICLCLISTLLSTITFPLTMVISSLINHINLSNIIPIWQTLSASFTQLIPISIGWLVAHYFPLISMYISKLLPVTAALAILTSLSSSILKIGTSLFDQWEIYVVSILLSILSYAIGWGLSKLIKLNPFQCRSVCFHVGFPNTTISIAIIQVSTGCLSPFLSIFPLHHSIFNMITGIIIFVLFLFCFSVVETVVEDSEVIEYKKSMENQLTEIELKLSNNGSLVDTISKISSNDTNTESLRFSRINI